MRKNSNTRNIWILCLCDPTAVAMFPLLSRQCCSRVRWTGRPLQRKFGAFISSNDLSHHPITQGETNLSITSIEDDSICVNNIYTRQSVIIFPKSFFLWNARTVQDINLSSLALIPVVFPTLEMLIIGCGESTLDVIPTKDLIEDFRQRGIVLKFMSSHHAATTFNVLNEEERHVGAAILLNAPPRLAEEEDLKLLAEFRGSK